MPARALLVLLVMLNLGVALWWLLKPAAPPVPPRPLPADVPRLQLLGERTEPPRASTVARVDAEAQADAVLDGATAEGADAPADGLATARATGLASDRTTGLANGRTTGLATDSATDGATSRTGAAGNAVEDAPR